MVDIDAMNNSQPYYGSEHQPAYHQSWATQPYNYDVATFNNMPASLEPMVPLWNMMSWESTGYTGPGCDTIYYQSCDMSSPNSDDDVVTTASGEPFQPVTDLPAKAKCQCDCGKLFGRPQDMYRHVKSVGESQQRLKPSCQELLTVFPPYRITRVIDGNAVFASEISHGKIHCNGTWRIFISPVLGPHKSSNLPAILMLIPSSPLTAPGT
jgi:hypothetical protein